MIEREILDRVPTYPGRVKMTHVSGDLYDMERADAPVEPGTPLDKATLDSIIKSRLTGRYYLPTVTKATVSSEIGIAANPIPSTSWVYTATRQAQSGSWMVQATSAPQGEGTIIRPFDGNPDTAWASSPAENAALTLIAENALTIKKVKVKATASNSASVTVLLQGSLDGSAWTEILRFGVGQSVSLEEIAVTTPGAYRYYRLYSPLPAGVSLSVYEWQITEYDLVTYRNDLVISDGAPNQWDRYQRITIVTPPEMATLGTVGNTLNGMMIENILLPARYYELIYVNDNHFWAKEL